MKISLDGDSSTTPTTPHWKFVVSFMALVVMIAAAAWGGAAQAQQQMVQHAADSVPVAELVTPTQVVQNSDSSISAPNETQLTYDPSLSPLTALLETSGGDEWAFQVYDSRYDNPMVSVRYDGSVELHPQASVDDAARAFWNALARYVPCKVQP